MRLGIRRILDGILGSIGPTMEDIVASIQADTSECGPCPRRPPGVDALVAVGLHRGPLADLIRRGKYESDDRPLRELGRWLAIEFLASSVRLENTRSWWGVAAVPQHPLRSHHRGIDHTFELAKAFSRESGIPMVRWLRRRWGPTQVGRGNAVRRRTGIDVVARSHGRRDVARIRARTGVPPGIILIDDVVTTGVTLSTCARILREMGVSAIHGVAASVSEVWRDGFVHQSSTRPPHRGLEKETAGIT